jgi:hypothetical protein
MGFKLMTKLGKILAPVLAIKDVRAARISTTCALGCSRRRRRS